MRFISFFLLVVVLLSGCGSLEKPGFSWWGCLSDPVRLANAEMIRAEAQVRQVEADRYDKLAEKQVNILSELENQRRGLPQEEQDLENDMEYDRGNAHQDYAMIEGSLANVTRLASGTIINETGHFFKAEIRNPDTETFYYNIGPYSWVPAHMLHGRQSRVLITHPQTRTSRELIKDGVNGWKATLSPK